MTPNEIERNVDEDEIMEELRKWLPVVVAPGGDRILPLPAPAESAIRHAIAVVLARAEQRGHDLGCALSQSGL